MANNTVIVANGVTQIEQQADNGCSMDFTQPDEAACTNDFQITCPMHTQDLPTGPGSIGQQTFHLNYDTDGKHVQGTATLTVTGPNGSCTGTYDVTFDCT